MSFLYEHVPFIFTRPLTAPARAATHTPALPRSVALGLGNLQWGDAGFGMRAIERLKAG
ncbi:hypothetical protein PWR63_06840 [Paraburkholderia sp. A2WS-5]|uniref:hypothetical protein n=1 Tax=unclassified Paraburkholderia TaxID=2615204 RepID=UPI003B80CF8D